MLLRLLSLLGSAFKRAREPEYIPARVRSRVLLPTVAEIHPSVLAALRRVDDRLDAYVVKSGAVWLLNHVDERKSVAEGRAMLQQERDNEIEGRIELNVSAHLASQGFTLLAIEEDYLCGQSAGYMEYLATSILGRSPAAVTADHAVARAEADGTAQAVRRAMVINERMKSSAREDWKWAYRGKRHFTRRGA